MRRRAYLASATVALAGCVTIKEKTEQDTSTHELNSSKSEDNNHSSKSEDSNQSTPDIAEGDKNQSGRDPAETDDELAEKDKGVLEENSGVVVITYDDSPIEDYEIAYSVHQEYGVPGCVGACPTLIKESSDNLHPWQLQELADAGWEIMSHTSDHRGLGFIWLNQGVTEGSTKVYPESSDHSARSDDEMVVYDRNKRVVGTVIETGVDSNGHYIRFDEPFPTSIGSEGAVRYTDETLLEFLRGSKRQLEKWVDTVSGFIYPYGRSDGVEDIVQSVYEYCPNQIIRSDGHNTYDSVLTGGLGRRYIETNKASKKDIEKFMANSAAQDVVSIVGGHTQYDTLDANRIEYVIRSALEHDLEIVTMREAVSAVSQL